jgi:hypothetical protein
MHRLWWLLLCTLLLSGCGITNSLVGRWEEIAVTDRHGQVRPPPSRHMILLISEERGDSASGKATITHENLRPDEWACGTLTVRRAGNGALTLRFFIGDTTSPALLMTAEVTGDSLYVGSMQTDEGHNALQTGEWDVFRRVSKHVRPGCLTRP